MVIIKLRQLLLENISKVVASYNSHKGNAHIVYSANDNKVYFYDTPFIYEWSEKNSTLLAEKENSEIILTQDILNKLDKLLNIDKTEIIENLGNNYMALGNVDNKNVELQELELLETMDYYNITDQVFEYMRNKGYNMALI